MRVLSNLLMVKTGSYFDQDPQLAHAALSMLLRHEYLNPCATALSLSRRFHSKPTPGELLGPTGGPVDEYAKHVDSGVANKDVLRQRLMGLMVFSDWDAVVDRYVAEDLGSF